MKKLLKFSLLLVANFSLAQGAFDVNFLKQNKKDTDFKIGTGFLIDKVDPRRSCIEYEGDLVSHNEGKETKIKIFHTKTADEYNYIKSKGKSGSIGFFNLFAAGGGKLEQVTNQEIDETERLIFQFNVDLGNYSYDDTKIRFTQEAQDLINKNKKNDFVKRFGTHFIKGYRRECSVVVILTRKNKGSENSNTQKKILKADGVIPYKSDGSLELKNNAEINKLIQEDEFSVDVEVSGIKINNASIKNQIDKVLNNKNEDKTEAIQKIIDDATKNIYDEEGVITQYTYASYAPYGLEEVYWDTEKENKLEKINQSIVKIYSLKKEYEVILDSLQREKRIKKDNFSEKSKIIEQNYQYAKKQIICLSKKIENQYEKCADVFCKTKDCCNFEENILKESEDIDYELKENISSGTIPLKSEPICNYDENISKETQKEEENVVSKAISEPGFRVRNTYVYKEDEGSVLEQGESPDNLKKTNNEITEEFSSEEYSHYDCERERKGIVTIESKSFNPYMIYRVYENGKTELIKVLEGKGTLTLYEEIGTYRYKAVQKSGFFMYPTVNHRQAIIIRPCQEVNLTIGYED